MNDLQAYQIEKRHPEAMFIDSTANGLRYAVDDRRRGLLISGRLGMTVLTLSQASACYRELGGILRDHLGVEI